MNIVSKIAFASLFAFVANTQAFAETAAKIVTVTPSNALNRTVTTITLDTDGTISRRSVSTNVVTKVVHEETTLIGTLHTSVPAGILADHEVYTRDDVSPNCPSEPDYIALSVVVDGVESVLIKGTSCVVGQKYYGPAFRFLNTIDGLSDLVK